MLKSKKVSKYFVSGCLENFLLSLLFLESMKSPKMCLPWTKNVNYFDKYYPAVTWPTVSAKFVLAYKAQNIAF